MSNTYEELQNDILKEAQDCFLTYCEEVLTDRAVPSIEDGLLSVHRKLIWTMEHVLKMTSKGNRKKSASIVGSTLASSYFHGDASCYGALCKMSLDYLMRYPLVIGQGSLGTQEDNDMHAAARYTEAKPSEFADLMMEDFNKNVVPLKETYNGEYMEPVVLPSAFPNAIVNGKESIAVGLSHNSVPHNLTEVCDAIIAYLRNENLTLDEFMTYVPGPDFPLGGTIINIDAIKEAYRTGKSKTSIKVRGDYEIKGNVITFTSIPYRTYRNKIKEQINTNIDEFDKIFDDFNDESNLGKNKLVFVVKKGIDPLSAVNKLFELTDLQTSISLNMNYIVNGTPKLCSILDMVKYYCEHQHNMMLNAANFDKEKAEVRAHIIRGLLVAVDKIDDVIAMIKSSNSRIEAIDKLIDFLSIDKAQAAAILDMKLGKLTRIDKQELVNELKEKEALIENLKKIIEDKAYRTSLLIDKIEKLKNKYGDNRKTKLMNLDLGIDSKVKKTIVKEDVVVILTRDGKISRTPVTSYSISKRGRKGDKTKIETLAAVKASTTDTLMLFTSTGKMFKILVDNIPVDITYLTNVIAIESNEKILNVAAMPNDKYMCFVTKNGMIKKTDINEYLSMSNRKTGVAAIKLKEGDSIVSVFGVTNEDIIMVSKNGMSIRFPSNDINVSGRNTVGVKGMVLNADDEVLAGIPIKEDKYLTTVSEDGVGRKTPIIEFTNQSRGGKGVILIKEHLPLAGCALTDDNSTILINGVGKNLCLSITDIPTVMRGSKGNILIQNKVEGIVKI